MSPYARETIKRFADAARVRVTERNETVNASGACQVTETSVRCNHQAASSHNDGEAYLGSGHFSVGGR